MVSRFLLLSCFLFFIIGTFADDSAVITLTSDNFDQVIQENPLILVEFYAPWCGHCKKLAPEYEKAAEELGKTLPLAKVDADDEKNRPLAQRFEIRGFPTLKLFRNGVPSDYQGERSSAALVSFMRKQAAPVVTEVKEADLESFSQSDKVVIVGFLPSLEGEQFAKFKSVAEKLRDKFVFGALNSASAAKKYGLESQPGVVLFKKFDEGKNVLPSSEFDQLESFISVNSVPAIDEIGPDNYRLYMESGLPLAYLFVDLKVEGQKEQYLDQVKDIAKSSKGQLNWVYIDWSKYARHSERLGLSGKVVPALAIERPDNGKHFAFDETATLSKDTIQPWVESFLKGELAPTIKSEEIPETNDGPVKVVVAKTYDQIVLDSSKDVLVEFYAPWCGHCKNLAPIYDQLGSSLASAPSVVIAKIDATANDVDPALGIRGFPTLKFFPAANKTPVDYNGDRSLEDLFNFVKEHATNKIDASLPVKEKEEL